MKKILVPTDFSPEAENALKVAAQLAHKYKSEIYLLHMLELPMHLLDSVPLQGARTNEPPQALYFMELARNKFAEILSRPFLQGLQIKEIVQFQEAFDGIMKINKEIGCDLIVMGSKGASGFKDMFIGSNTEKVVRTSETPVLVIKNEDPDFKVENFVFATEFNQETKAIMPQVVKIAEVLEARLHLVYINTAGNFLSSKESDLHMEQFMEGLDFSNYSLTTYNDSSAEAGILNFAAKINADLVGIATHGRQGLSHFFNGSISEDLVNHAKRPVITFKL